MCVLICAVQAARLLMCTTRKPVHNRHTCFQHKLCRASLRSARSGWRRSRRGDESSEWALRALRAGGRMLLLQCAH